MEEAKGKIDIGLSWKPKLPSQLFSPNSTTTNPRIQIRNPTENLIDGLFVPPNDPKKLNKLAKMQIKDTTGKFWFDMPAPTMTPELKKDLQLLKLRSVIDPKRHYKKGDTKSKSLPKYFQVGTVVESASDFFTGRLTKKERKATLADELLSDQKLNTYRKRKVREIEEENRPGGVDKWNNRSKHSSKRGKQRRH